MSHRATRLAFVVIAIAASSARADLIHVAGDLGAHLELQILSVLGQGFEVPSSVQRAAFAGAVEALLSLDIQEAADLADDAGYDLFEFTHTGNLEVYYVLQQQLGSDHPGQGWYVFNPGWRRKLNIQAPHVPTDMNTGPEAIDTFLWLDALFLQLNGAWRCATSEASPCSGSGPPPCLGSVDGAHPFRTSDAAHFTRCFFHVASDAVAAHHVGLTTIQVHAFFVCEGRDADDTPAAQISNGAGNTPNSLATRIALAYNDGLQGAGYTGRLAVSCNATDDDPAEVQAVDVCPELCGGSNVQGRSINGSPDACNVAVHGRIRSERFIHMERLGHLTRAGPGLPDFPGVSRQVCIDALGRVFPAPSQLWADFDHFGFEDGAFATPYNTMAEALHAASAGQMIRIKAGSTDESATIRQRVTLRSYGGNVLIGR